MLFGTINAQISNRSDYSIGHLNFAMELEDKRDYIAAAKLYKNVIEGTKDSAIYAEALYRFKKAGDHAVSSLNDLYWREGINLDSIIKNRVDQLRAMGFNIRLVSYFETYYVNADTLTSSILLNNYSDTKWAEKIEFDLITYEVNVFGERVEHHPLPIIRKAESFIEKYPNSTHTDEVNIILGKAYTDIWNLYQMNEHLIPKEFRKRHSLDSVRVRALEFFSRESEGAEFSFSGIVKALENKERLNIFFYYAD